MRISAWVTFFGQSPIVSIHDLRKMKFFIWAGSKTESDIWKKFGVKPIPLPATDIHTGLKSGMINSFSTTPLAAASFQWFGSAKEMTDLKWAALIGATIVRNSTWEKISEADRAEILRAAKNTELVLKNQTRGLGGKAVGIMKKHGLKVHPVPEETRKEWEKLAVSAYPDIMKLTGIPKGIVDDILRHRDEFRTSQQAKK